jgi:hypothetical protein
MQLETARRSGADLLQFAEESRALLGAARRGPVSLIACDRRS